MHVDSTPAFGVRLADWKADENALRAIRLSVFVVEQHVPEQLEWDGIDGQCLHVIAEDAAGMPVGCGRLLPDGHIGRMAVIADWRGCGVGAEILRQLLEVARERRYAKVRLHAQVHAIPFYARSGFTAVGVEFEEAGIPHRTMERAFQL